MKWLRFIRKLKPYNIQKGLRYLKHYGPKEFLDVYKRQVVRMADKVQHVIKRSK